MREILRSISGAIGNTPLIRAGRFMEAVGAGAEIYAKLEYFNPTGSVKDRAAFQMLSDAIESGAVDKNTTVMEATSGNTGIGLASICASCGLRCIIVMPENMSEERIKLIRAYGAEVVLTPAEGGMEASVRKLGELREEYAPAFCASQFDNPSNIKAHMRTTGPEIWKQTGGDVDILVSAVGSAGTVMGCSRYLKSVNPLLMTLAVEPDESPVLSGGEPGRHGIQGIGANFMPPLFCADDVDEILRVPTEAAYSAARLFASREGALVGISSGAALAAAAKASREPENEGKKIVVICPDGGDRYYSTKLFGN